MRYLLSFLLLFVVVSLTAQEDEHHLVRAAVQDYIDGTSFNKPELLENSFHPAISMYFSKGGENWMPARKTYIGFFGGDNYGKPTGRIGNIRLIEVAGDVATAKAEILSPKSGRLFIDYFLLKKIEGKWWIVSKTASNAPSHQLGKRILFVVSNADRYGDTELPTGNQYGEVAAAYHVFQEAGYTVDFASPEGGKVAVTYLSSVDSLTAPYLRDAEFWYRLNHTHRASGLVGKDYEAVYFPGGSAAMFGVADNPDVQRLTRDIYEAKGPVAAVCHGTAGITNVILSDGTPMLKGKQITGFPDARERHDAPYYKTFTFTIDGRVNGQGGTFQSGEMNTGYFLQDGLLVTGMDQTATVDVARAVVKLIQQ